MCLFVIGTASLDPKSNGKISGIAFAYINCTNVFGCVLGIVLTLIFKPGKHSNGIKCYLKLI